jgi:hypothetical protein
MGDPAVGRGRDVRRLSRSPRQRRTAARAAVGLGLQVLCGLLLYVGLSPFTSAAMSNMGLALRDPALRFWAFTHLATMVVALIAVRAGRVLAMGEPASRARRNGRFICFGIALLAMAAGIPWPGLANARPLFRL